MIRDIFGRKWNLPRKELCPSCLQPDSTGDCDHRRLLNYDVRVMKGFVHPRKKQKIRKIRYTPEPWWVDDDHNIAAGSGEDYKTIADPRCMKATKKNMKEMDANTDLISAAPQMYEALRMFLQLDNRCHHGVIACGECAVCLGEKAIAKAEGKG